MASPRAASSHGVPWRRAGMNGRRDEQIAKIVGFWLGFRVAAVRSAWGFLFIQSGDGAGRGGLGRVGPCGCGEISLLFSARQARVQTKRFPLRRTLVLDASFGLGSVWTLGCSAHLDHEATSFGCWTRLNLGNVNLPADLKNCHGSFTKCHPGYGGSLNFENPSAPAGCSY